MTNAHFIILLSGIGAFVITLFTQRVVAALVIPTVVALFLFIAESGMASGPNRNGDSLMFLLGWSPLFIGIFAGAAVAGTLAGALVRVVYTQLFKRSSSKPEQ